MPSTRPEPLELRRKDAVDLGYATAFHVLLRAIDEAMPADAILVLEGGATAPTVATFLREHAAGDPRQVVAHAGNEAAVFHLPLADGNLGRLRLLAEDCLSSEIASHLAVYRDDEVLLWAHDAGNGPVWLAASLPDGNLEQFRAALGTTLRPLRRSLWSRLRGTN